MEKVDFLAVIIMFVFDPLFVQSKLCLFCVDSTPSLQKYIQDFGAN